MIRSIKTLAALAMASAICLQIPAQQTREQAIAGMRTVDAKEMDPSYTKPAPVAQKLVDEALVKHPEVILLAIHAQPAGHKNVIVGSNFGRIGKIGDEDDMRCIHTGKANLEVNTAGNHFEVEVPLKDKAGKIVGALSVVFNYKPGDDKAADHRIADEVEAEMRAQLSQSGSLFAAS